MDPVSIHCIKLKNVKGFKNIDVDLGTDATSVVLTGNNGTGKSTFLRAIALGLCDHMGVYSMMSELSGSIINNEALDNNEPATIEVCFITESGSNYTWKTIVTVDDDYGTERVERKYISYDKSGKEISSEGLGKFPYYDLFCTAYGAGSRIFGKERYRQYYHTDSVYQLFKTDFPLTEQEVTIRRVAEYELNAIGGFVKARERRLKTISAALTQVLNLPKSTQIKIDPSSTGIYFLEKQKNPETGEILEQELELSQMGDGVRAMTTLLLDLMSWWHLYVDGTKDSKKYHDLDNRGDMITNFADYHGIVIIDEIEIHLHPTWQKNIIRWLVELLPNVQFIMSTHSAMCVSGATDLRTDNKVKFLRLYPDHALELELSPGSTVNDILRHKAFDVESVTNEGFDIAMAETIDRLSKDSELVGLDREKYRDMAEKLRINTPDQKYLKEFMEAQIDLMKDIKKK